VASGAAVDRRGLWPRQDYVKNKPKLWERAQSNQPKLPSAVSGQQPRLTASLDYSARQDAPTKAGSQAVAKPARGCQAAAYGWEDYSPEMPDEVILSRLLALYSERARAKTSA
jgi:hypothetical protein